MRMKGEGMGEERCGVRRRAVALLRDCSGQGTTEYAILVGVLVVIAFKGKVQELWTAIADGMNSL